jgi:hypothetical protein
VKWWLCQEPDIHNLWIEGRKVMLSGRLGRITILAMVALSGTAALAQSKLVVWPKEPGRRIRPGGQPGGQSNALAQFDSFEIEDITVEEKSIIIGQPFVASDDWLNAITIRIKNVSQQKFRTIQMTLTLPEIKSGPDIPLCYGCAIKERSVFAPGDEVELKTLQSSKFYDWVKLSISEKTSLSSITTAQIYLTTAILSDGTSWFSECVKTANPQNACPKPYAPNGAYR